MTGELAGRLGLALAIGLLIGLERGWRDRHAPDRSRRAGIRTFGISGLLGGVFALLADAMEAPTIFIAGFLGFASILALYKLREGIDEGDYSVTAVVAGFTVFALGALAVVGDLTLAAGAGAALAAVLASRELLHGFLRRLSWEELRSALILVVMTAIVLPLLPDRTVDPWGGVNPRQIWLFTTLVAALSYAGYAATRLLGQERGLLLSSLLGAIVSSTAVTVALARRSGEAPSAMAGAAALAAAVSICRVCLIVTVAAPALLTSVAAPALGAALVFTAIGGLLLIRVRTVAADKMKVKNPFELAPLLLFAASFAVIAAISAYLTDAIGETGMLATAAISGTFDVDVAVLSAVRQVGTTSAAASAEGSGVVNSVLLALLANGVGRTLLASLSGDWRFTGTYLSASLLAAMVGIAIYAT